MSFGQERLWFLDQLQPNSAALYNIPMGLRLGGPLNVSVLQRCLNEVLRRHETLSTNSKRWKADQFQKIQTAASIEIALVDLTKLPKREREVEVKRLCVEEAQQRSNWHGICCCGLGCFGWGRPITFSFKRTSYRLGRLVYRIAGPQLTILYEAFLEGQSSPLPELPIQYVDYAVWQREQLTGEA